MVAFRIKYVGPLRNSLFLWRGLPRNRRRKRRRIDVAARPVGTNRPGPKAQVIPVHKLWTNDSWLLTPDELAAALPHAPTTAVDRPQLPLPWWRQWLDYLDTVQGHGGIRVC